MITTFDIKTTPHESIIDEVLYSSYVQNRKSDPTISPERWGKIYANAKAMEKRYQAEIIAKSN